MPDFGHLKTTKRDTAEYKLYDVPGEPTLFVRPSNESNKRYFNEKLRVAEKHRQRRAKMSVELFRELRDRDRELFPQFVVTGWKDVCDVNGAPVPFTRDNCEAFLRAMDDDLFDDLRNFCDSPANFRDDLDAAGAAGNSQTA